MTALYPYQQEGAAWLAGKRAALLADEMGLGKSAQAIMAVSYHFDDTQTPRIGVVCPASVRENWRREFEKFWPNILQPHLIVESYDKVARDPDVLLGGERLDYLIVDEAHYLKSPTAKRTRAVFGEKCDGVGGIVEKADRVILLTGTPMPNNPSELWPALRALAPKTILGKSGRPDAYWQFVKRYCKTRNNGFGIEILGAKNHDALKAAIAPFVLRRTKEEVLDDLPEIAFEEICLEGTAPDSLPEVRDATWAVAEALRTDGVEGLQKLAGHVATLRRLTGLAKVPSVVEWVREFLESTDRKIVLFAHHKDVVRDLVGQLSVVTGVGFIDGSVDTDLRAEIVDAFQSDPACRVFIGQIQAAGTGITLTAASDVLFVESSWVPAENSQAAMRVHRIGQKNACLIRFATLAGSIDERIQRAVRRKTADITRIMG